jgi:hypothetical protein
MDVMTSVSAFSSSALTASASIGGVHGQQSAQAAEKTDNPYKISDEDQRAVNKLKARDREVRAHEQAHQSAGGQHAGSASYSYQSGPDGRQYAVGGEVPIDAGAVEGDPRATIEKMRQVKAAALAPAKPSGQDRKVAAMADATAAKAQAELNAQRGQESDPAAPQGRLDGSLAQQLAEVRQHDEPSGFGSSASTAPDLSAYATNAYRHQASSIANLVAGNS